MKTILFLAILSMGLVTSAYANSEVTRIQDLAAYQQTIIEGEVVGFVDGDEFLLKDESGTLRVYTGWNNTYPVSVGENIRVRGTLDGGIIKQFREFYASEIIRENGDVLKLNAN